MMTDFGRDVNVNRKTVIDAIVDADSVFCARSMIDDFFLELGITQTEGVAAFVKHVELEQTGIQDDDNSDCEESSSNTDDEESSNGSESEDSDDEISGRFKVVAHSSDDEISTPPRKGKSKSSKIQYNFRSAYAVAHEKREEMRKKHLQKAVREYTTWYNSMQREICENSKIREYFLHTVAV
jgi:hypothetical protein